MPISIADPRPTPSPTPTPQFTDTMAQGSLLDDPNTDHAHRGPVVETVTRGRVTLVTLQAPSLRGPALEALDRALQRLISPDHGGAYRVVIAMEKTRDLTSAAVSVIGRAAAKLAALDGRLVVFGAPDIFRQIAAASQLRGVIHFERDEAAAIASAEGKPARKWWKLAG